MIISARLAFAVAALALCRVSAAAAEPAYHFGLPPEQAKEVMLKKWVPLMEDVSKRAGVKIVVDVEDGYDAFYDKYARGSYDIVLLNPRSYVTKTKDGEYKAFARQRAKLQGIIIVRKDSPAQTLKDLKGKKLAFPSPDSYASTVLPKADLKAAGVDPERNATYAGNHDKVYDAVASGQADAGGAIMRTFIQLKPEEAAKLRILHTTKPAITHPFVANKRLPESVVDKLQGAMVELANSPESNALLKAAGMSPVMATSDAEYDALRKELR